ncbi:MAG: ATP-binding protein, partial [Candidatus Binatia bacterium]
GRVYDFEAKAARPEPLLYDSKDLTTHAVCVGMTGSGKTGLCLALLEEAALDGIPAIAIDPKGDLGNLLLTFPELRPADFRPWIDESDAAKKGRSLDEEAAAVAETWRKGLADWGQDAARIARLRAAADFAVYTPGSSAGLPLSVLRSLDAPPAEVVADPDALRERVGAVVAGLLALLGIEGEPLRSREHVLLATIVDRAWREGQGIDLAGLVRFIQTPPFDRVGVLDLESFFPAKDRAALAGAVNAILASPGFAGWMEGEPLDVARLFRTPDGKPRVSILSIAHLSDAERMFFVTLLLGEVISWMRAQPGTPSLRAILYMDEIFGFFPPTANPPSKTPMLTLLKQARAYGLGVVLATQNPVDLDYKGLANTGTWFLGRLQTERDKARVLDGLEGASVASGRSFDRARIEAILSGLGQRVFLMNDVHDDEPVAFQSRWAMSYLRGPLTRAQIASLTAERKKASPAAAPTATAPAPRVAAVDGGERPVVGSGVSEVFVASRAPRNREIAYRPALCGAARVRYADGRDGIWTTLAMLAPLETDAVADAWAAAEALDGEPELDAEPAAGARFAELPVEASRAKSYDAWSKALADHLYRTATLAVRE